MANDNLHRNAFEDKLIDDELCNLFSAFDEVSASDELKDATLARILKQDEEVKAIRSGNSPSTSWRAKWHAIRVAAIAACLALALTGGVAYATPASFYDVVQDGATVTLGVNCFGITVSATSDDETGEELIGSTNLRGIPYEKSLARAIEAMEERNPDMPIEYGMRGEERETIPPAEPADGFDNHGNAADDQLGYDDPQGYGSGDSPASEPVEGTRGSENPPAETGRPGEGQSPSDARQNENGPADGAGPNGGEH